MSSTHSAASYFNRTGLFNGLSSFSDFAQRLKNLANTKEVGDAFEILVEGYLYTQPHMQAKNVWLVGQVPLRIRKQLNLPSDSKGIDGIFETRTGDFVPYQVKYRTDTDVLPYGEVSSFLGITERSCKDRVLFTNARELSKDIANRDGLRSVRAMQFHALTTEDFSAIEAWLDEKPIKHERRTSRPYQQEAIRQITEILRTQDRTTAVMACGTGKTLVALWVAEQLEPKTVLVLVPSLALLSQTLPDWCKESKWGEKLEYLCVCSDPTVSKGVDAFTIRPQDANFPSTTDAKEVRRFLSRKTDDVKVVFSTYQSAPVVAQGVKDMQPFDVAIFDEAHKTTGPQAGLFAFGLSDKNLLVRKRLFLTATPRHYDIKHRDKDGDFCLVSMDDESVYGSVSYRLSFASAVKQGIICPYKIVISITTKEEVDNELLKHGTTLVKRDEIQARWVATQLALERAIERTKASKVITFHSRVALAQDFASAEPRGISQHLSGFEVLHVNGSQSTADRESLLHDFRTSVRGLITNARCLTEGVDVPAVDMVAFIDPRRSKIDIAQATGRAMRQSQATGKTTGYIVVPLFLEQQKGETEEQAFQRSGFDDVAMVVAAMQEQDEDLIDIIRELRQQEGEGKPFNPRRLAERIEVYGPNIALSELKSAIAIEVVDRVGLKWDERFGRLVEYAREHGHCRVPQRFESEDGFKLGAWVANQRSNKDKLSLDKRHRLESLKGWSWNTLADAWEEGYEHLKSYCEAEGHCRVHNKYEANDGFKLGSWVANQRQDKDKMPKERRHRLEKLKGWSWDWLLDDWEEGYTHLRDYCETEGHCRVPVGYKTKDGFKLGLWAANQRHRQDVTSVERRQRLESLKGWSWDPLSDAWEEGYEHLKSYCETEGHCRVPQKYKTQNGFKMGLWVTNLRHKRKDTMSIERRKRLESLEGWSWDPFSDAWEEGYRHLTEFCEIEGHCRVLQRYKAKDGYKLGTWVNKQRNNRDTLSSDSPEKRRRLENLKGWSWEAHSDAWEEGFGHLQSYCNAEGHCRVPDKYRTEDEFKLGSWASTQRQNKDTLSPEKRHRLENLKGWSWDLLSDAWEKGFGHLESYCNGEGHCRVPQSYKTTEEFKLGSWVANQRQDKDKMPKERRHRLESLKGWSWDPLSDAWEESYGHLKSYCNSEGHSRVPKDYETQDGFKLGGWVANQRSMQDTMIVERRQRLESLKGWSWDPLSDAWEEGFQHLKSYCNAEDHCRVPHSYKTKEGFKLGFWVASQRSMQDTMTAERRQRLESLKGWSWEAHSDAWEEGYGHLQRYCGTKGDCLVPSSFKSSDGYGLGRWVSFQRQSRVTMLPERKERLERLKGWSWDPLSDRWEEGYRHLWRYCEIEGHCRVPLSYQASEGYKLGTWIQIQRMARAKMSLERRNRLESVNGWSWDPLSDAWENGYGHLKSYCNAEGHCRVPRGYRCKEGFKLGFWVANQRQNKEGMPLERRQRLENLKGWKWRPET